MHANTEQAGNMKNKLYVHDRLTLDVSSGLFLDFVIGRYVNGRDTDHRLGQS